MGRSQVRTKEVLPTYFDTVKQTARCESGKEVPSGASNLASLKINRRSRVRPPVPQISRRRLQMAPRRCSEDEDKIATASVKKRAAASGVTCAAVANNKGIQRNGTQIERTGDGEAAACEQVLARR